VADKPSRPAASSKDQLGMHELPVKENQGTHICCPTLTRVMPWLTIIQCDGTNPFCSECIRSGSRCLYENVDKRKTETWRIAVNDLEQKNHQLGSLVQSLKCDSFPEAVERLRQLRGDLHQQPDRHEEITVGTPGFSDTSSSSFGLATSINPYLAASVDRPSASRSVSDNDALVDLGYANLPCEDMTRHAVNSFKTCGATLFHVMSQETLDVLIQKVYHHDPGVTPSDVCQLCALAAVGSQYCTNEIPASAKEAYYQHAFVLLDQLEDDDLAHMRVFTCLAVYLVMLKSTSARTMTGMFRHLIYETCADGASVRSQRCADVYRDSIAGHQ
jgi:hypothetical protein